MQRSRTVIFFLFIVSALYCYGAGIVDYFGVYEPWKLINENDFAAFHQFQGSRIVALFVIPSAVMTLFNLFAAIWPPAYVNRRWLWCALAAYAFDWIFSFTMQIPIQLELEKGKDPGLINELLRTNWWRFAADTIHICIVLFILWKLVERLRQAIQ